MREKPAECPGRESRREEIKGLPGEGLLLAATSLWPAPVAANEQWPCRTTGGSFDPPTRSLREMIGDLGKGMVDVWIFSSDH
jgi:hypothetical protein